METESRSMRALAKQIQFFENEQESLIQQYEGLYIIISPSLEVSPFPNIQDAYRFGVREYGLGNFLMKDCSPASLRKVHIITPNIVAS